MQIDAFRKLLERVFHSGGTPADDPEVWTSGLGAEEPDPHLATSGHGKRLH